MESQEGSVGPVVHVEVVLLRAQGGALASRTRRGRLVGPRPPDALAAALCDGADVAVLHSTSWRHEPQGCLVLTYVGAPDAAAEERAAILQSPAVVSSGDPLRPGPPGLHEHHVVAHAVRHLAELAGRDPAVRLAAADPGAASFWLLLADVARTTPTATHAASHAAAHARARSEDGRLRAGHPG